MYFEYFYVRLSRVSQHESGGQNDPARNNALSNISARLVAAKMITPLFEPKPSISVNNWFNVFSRSSFPPMLGFLPRARPTASISSMKIMQGAFSSPCGTSHVHGMHLLRQTFPQSRNLKAKRKVHPPHHATALPAKSYRFPEAYQ